MVFVLVVVGLLERYKWMFIKCDGFEDIGNCYMGLSVVMLI